MSLSKDQLDILCGVKKPQTSHDFHRGDRVVTNSKQFMFFPGRFGKVVGFDEYNLVIVKLDILPRLTHTFHPSHLELVRENDLT